MSCTFNTVYYSIVIQQYCTMTVLIKRIIFEIISSMFNKILCPQISSLAPNNLVFVERFVLIFCFDDPEYTAPHTLPPRLIICL